VEVIADEEVTTTTEVEEEGDEAEAEEGITATGVGTSPSETEGTTIRAVGARDGWKAWISSQSFTDTSNWSG